jgi:hypothetical protein
MKKLSLTITAAVLVCCVLVLAVYSQTRQQPSQKELKRAFPGDSYEVFTKSQKVVLFSLEPGVSIANSQEDWAKAATGAAEYFHDYRVLGKTEVKDAELQTNLKSSLLKAMPGGDSAACFNPRHGLRLIVGDKVVDLLICFECGTFITYYNADKGKASLFGKAPAQLYNRTLLDAGVELTKNSRQDTGTTWKH